MIVALLYCMVCAGLNVPYATAYRALFTKGHAKGGETALIHGASGGVGIAAVQVCHAPLKQTIGALPSASGHFLFCTCAAPSRCS
jgi:NADPH2:quinone reductase